MQCFSSNMLYRQILIFNPSDIVGDCTSTTHRKCTMRKQWVGKSLNKNVHMLGRV